MSEQEKNSNGVNINYFICAVLIFSLFLLFCVRSCGGKSVSDNGDRADRIIEQQHEGYSSQQRVTGEIAGARDGISELESRVSTVQEQVDRIKANNSESRTLVKTAREGLERDREILERVYRRGKEEEQ